MIRKKIGLILLISLLVNMLVFGQIQPAVSGTFGSEFQVNTTTTNNQDTPAIAMDSGGNFVVCWTHDGIGDDIIAQRYSYPYTAQGNEITVTSASGNQQYPAIAMDSSGNFVVCWQDYGGGNGDVKAQRYDSSGAAQGTEITVASGAGNQGFPSVAMDSSGNFVVVWEDSAGAGYDVTAQRYDSSGTAQGSAINVATDASNERYPAVAMDSGDFVVCWHDDAGTGNDTKAQLYDSNGTAQGSTITVASGAGDQDDVAAGMDSSGDFVVAWEDSAAGNNDVKAQRYNSSGTAQSSAITVASGTGAQENPAVAMDSYGSFIIAWEDDAGGDDDVKGQRYNSSGTALGSTFTANNTTTNNQTSATAAVDDNGGSAIGWQSTNQDTSGEGVFAQRYSNLSTTWYFAEGYTGEGFNEWLTLQNPNSVAASVTITYMFRDATTQTENKTVAANSRETVSVNADVGANKEVSMQVVSDQPIIAERPMYFNYQGKWQGGHNTIGATSTSTDWYFAEGYTGTGFEEWLTLQNPTGTDATVTITYYFRGGGTVVTKTKTVLANSRETISVNSDVGSDQEVSIKISSTQAIIAERPMYFNYQGKWQGGHNTIGATSTSTDWYFAEGYTGSGFEEWLTLQNPTGTDATATITYYYRGGATPTVKTKTVPANSRETINVNSDAGADKEVSIKVESTQAIIAERPMYFNYQDQWQGGHNTVGVTTPVNQWFFAEGYTGDGFAEWLTLQNPNATDATATITYYYRGGATPTVKTKTIAANSRETIDVNTDAGTGKEVSIKVSSTNPIIAERPMYFSYQGIWQGGHDTIGFGP